MRSFVEWWRQKRLYKKHQIVRVSLICAKMWLTRHFFSTNQSVALFKESLAG